VGVLDAGAAPFAPVRSYPLGLQRADLCKAKRLKCRSTLLMDSVTLDWLDLTVILSTFATCALMGLFAAWLMSRFEVVKPTEPVAPVVEVQQIEITVMHQERRTARAAAGSFRGSPRKFLSLPRNKAIDRTEGLLQ
jgi:hypothetical protein